MNIFRYLKLIGIKESKEAIFNSFAHYLKIKKVADRRRTLKLIKKIRRKHKQIAINKRYNK